jgi:GT2 family glycosyltransferase
LDVIVVEAGAAEGVTNRVASVMPSAFVRRRPDAAGFAAAANEVLEGIEGASFFLFCRDDVALAPRAVALMVEEAFRSNAGIVGPKLVDWDLPDRLLQIGIGVSRFGVPVPRIQAGELDQAQHDEVREVFAVPSACLLTRVDLFSALEGFDTEMGDFGEDVDLCWRAQLAGARVVSAPRAIVRHVPVVPADARSAGDELVTRRRNELRAVLKNYGVVRRWLTVVQLLVLTVLDSVTAPLTGRRERARVSRAAWRWNFAHRRSLSRERHLLHEIRQESDRVIAARMSPRGRVHRWLPIPAHAGDVAGARRAAPPRRSVRSLGIEGTGGPAPPAHSFGVLAAGRPGRGERHLEVDRLTEWLVRAQHGEVPVGQLIAGVVICLLMLFGTRNLLFGSLPVIGDLVPGPSALHLLGQWFGGRSDPGWGTTQVGPPAYGVIGLVGTVLGNSSGIALKLAYVSGLAIGTAGVWRLVRDFGSSRARIVAAVAFAASPLVWNGLAHGDVEVSVALAGLPFVLARLGRASGLRPFVPAHGPAKMGWDLRSLFAEIAPLGLLLAVMGALAPAVLLDVGVIVVTTLVASVVVGGAGGMVRSVVVGAGGLVVAFLCCLPWSVTWLQTGARWSLFAGSVAPGGSALSPAALLRAHTGPVGAWWGAAGLVALAAFAFVWARGPRLAWAARWWVCALGSIVLAWVGSSGWLGAGGGDAEVLVAPAIVAFAACCGIATAAFQLDLKHHRFGWRQITAVLAVGCFVVGLVPALGDILGGRGNLPGVGFEETAGEFTTSFPPGARVVWIGDAPALPGAAFQAGPGISEFVTTTGLPSMATLWPNPDPGPASAVTADIDIAMAGRTLRLGALLAPTGVRYVVVPTAPAPVLVGEQTPPPAPPPPALLRALDSQTDLRQLPPEDGVLVWANAAWVPGNGAGAEASAGSGNGTDRLIGVVLALLAILACLAEGVTRRRRAGRRRAGVVAASPGGEEAPAAESPPEQVAPEVVDEASQQKDIEAAESAAPRGPAVVVVESASEVASPIVPAGSAEESGWR